MYKTIASACSAKYTEKMSRFLAFVHPVQTAEQARAVVKEYQNKYHDARHVCWAYMIGPARAEWQVNDNGEPSGTAGRPILGQINSFELTDVVAIVVRYFGGIKLGTGGLTAAYRTATRMAIEESTIEERHEMVCLKAEYQYEEMNNVMRIVKNMQLKVTGQKFDNMCVLELSCRADQANQVVEALQKQARVERI